MRHYSASELSAILDSLGPDHRSTHKLLADYAEQRAREVPAGPITKWDVLHPIERAGLDATPIVREEGTLTCSGCGTPLPTEGDFARHFIVTNRRLLNLGECPNPKPMCEWYAKCYNRSSGTVNHPTLGDIPTCERCRLLHNLVYAV